MCMNGITNICHYYCKEYVRLSLQVDILCAYCALVHQHIIFQD